ncbi:hypothetical protein [Microbacterium capsulatum]|uniref:Uncharacterized protein n=1 Tax=Microbacterium capsulatum TaxID=3041921 RepID=A0ABU0XJC6_9MICO|nr:hypothetical protein [Microbacterium sp. ASV81]MDQ4215249.1 hypothetical protein [Microbacterium sp. ASV81]
MSVVLVVLGVVLMVSSVLMVIFRRRVTENMVRAGAVPGGISERPWYPVVIGVMQLLLGVFLVTLPAFPSVRASLRHSGLVFDAVAAGLGEWAMPIAALVNATAVVSVLAGVRMIFRSWRRREDWRVGDRVVIPARDRVMIGVGTALLAYGGIGFVAGVAFVLLEG